MLSNWILIIFLAPLFGAGSFRDKSEEEKEGGEDEEQVVTHVERIHMPQLKGQHAPRWRSYQERHEKDQPKGKEKEKREEGEAEVPNEMRRWVQKVPAKS